MLNIIWDDCTYKNVYNIELVEKLLKNHYKKFPKKYFLPSFIDNHDMDRFIFSCGNSFEKFKDAVNLQFKIDQPIIIYYGSEIGISQEKSMWDVKTHGDLQARKPMSFYYKDNQFYNLYKEVIEKKVQEHLKAMYLDKKIIINQ